MLGEYLAQAMPDDADPAVRTWLDGELRARAGMEERTLLGRIGEAAARQRERAADLDAARTYAAIEVAARSLADVAESAQRGILAHPAESRGVVGEETVKDVVDRAKLTVAPGDQLSLGGLATGRVDVAVPPPASTLEGATLSGYKLQELLGYGGFGCVYLGENAVGKRVAIKVPHHPSQARRVLREAKLLFAVNHPAIVHFENLVLEGTEHPHLICELVEGKTLREVLRERGTLDAATIRRISEQVLLALDHAHSHGVLHLDLKPENLMVVGDLNGEFQIKVLDFGIGRVASQSALSLSVSVSQGAPGIAGTIDYMAPEQHDGLPDLDERADLYALGITLFEFVTGRRPRGRASLATDDATLVELFERTFVDDREERLASAAEGLAILRGTEQQPQAPTPEPQTPQLEQLPTSGPGPRGSVTNRRARRRLTDRGQTTPQ